MCFSDFDFLVFFCNFWRFGFDFGGPGPSKNCPKSKKNIFGTRLEYILDPRAILGSILEWFFEILDGFCRILGGFGRISNDYKHCRLQSLLWWLGRRGADQVDLIICKAIFAVQRSQPPLLCDDSRVISIASRNKLRSRLPFLASRFDFGTILGGFRKPKWSPESIFWMLFCDAFECVSASILDRFLDARTPKHR